MIEDKDRTKASKRIHKYVTMAIRSLEKAEGENTEWKLIPDEIFTEIIDVLDKVGNEVNKSDA